MNGNRIFLFILCCCSRKGTGGSFKAVGYKGTEHHTHKHPGVLIHRCEKKSSALFNLLNIHICVCVCTSFAARPPFVPYAYLCPQEKADYVDTWRLKTPV